MNLPTLNSDNQNVHKEPFPLSNSPVLSKPDGREESGSTEQLQNKHFKTGGKILLWFQKTKSRPVGEFYIGWLYRTGRWNKASALVSLKDNRKWAPISIKIYKIITLYDWQCLQTVYGLQYHAQRGVACFFLHEAQHEDILMTATANPNTPHAHYKCTQYQNITLAGSYWRATDDSHETNRTPLFIFQVLFFF